MKTVKFLPLITMLVLMAGTLSHAQIAISTNGSSPDNSAMMDVQSTDKGFFHDHPGCFIVRVYGWENSFVGTYPLQPQQQCRKSRGCCFAIQ